jgi:hypothetical protein
MGTELKEFAIVKAIMKALKLDDAGKISKFINQEIKSSEENIESLKLNLKITELTRKQRISEFDRKIEDARDLIESEYQNISPSDVSTNSLMQSFSDTYWKRVYEAEAALEQILNEATLEEESYKREVAFIEDQISKYQSRIKKLSK